MTNQPTPGRLPSEATTWYQYFADLLTVQGKNWAGEVGLAVNLKSLELLEGREEFRLKHMPGVICECHSLTRSTDKT